MILVVHQPEYQPNVAWSILESKGMRGIFQKKSKIFNNLGKNVQNLEHILKKGSLMRATITGMKQQEYVLCHFESPL